jgi:predicted nucleotidyltransferase component of viral defense system
MQNGDFIMIPTLLNKDQLQIINRKSLRYGLSTAEKDYFLTIVAKVINESELAKKIVFKGGTAIYHCYLPQMRFSEDLDFTSLTRDITTNEVKKVLESQPFLNVKKEFTSQATIKIEKLQYSGLLAQPNSLKVEIDFIQNIILPAKELPYKNVWGIDVKMIVMDIREIAAEKIRAMNDRVRYRDFFDFYLIMNQIKPNFSEIFNLIKQKEVRKIITKENILSHWKTAQSEKQKEFGIVYYNKEIFDNDALITKVLEKLDFTPITANSVFQKEAKKPL